MVFQQPWHGLVPGELVVSVLGCRLRVASSNPAVWGGKRGKKFFGFYAVISSAGGIPNYLKLAIPNRIHLATPKYRPLLAQLWAISI